AALTDGTIVVGATGGLMLLDPAGGLRPHPDPAAMGRSNDLVSHANGAFALRAAQSGSELLAIDAQTVRVLWQDTTSWTAIAALQDSLILMRATNRLVELVAISPIDGSEIERRSALVEQPVDYVFARASAGLAFALLVFRNGTMALGSVGTDSFTTLAEGVLSIAGPLSAANATLLGLDGQLVQLTDAALLPLVAGREITCLAERDGLRYACERDGITELSGETLGAPLFRFDWLDAPALERVPAGEPRMLCNTQWQDFLLDRQLSMPSVPAVPGVPAVPTAGASGAPPVAAGASAAGSGCSVHHHQSAADAYIFYVVVAWAFRRVCTRREHQ
ncbi:MAG TPA: hypothetical protein VMF89_12005, partial [Polyangiales bacterium]|nr:hypothetical protein [Polyangiales bacterium]